MGIVREIGVLYCSFGDTYTAQAQPSAKNIDWNAIYCECNHDIYHLIRDYVKGVRFMKPKEKEKILQKSTSEISVDFKEQTPKVEIHSPKPDPLYEKALLSRDNKNTSEYALNTTTWD